MSNGDFPTAQELDKLIAELRVYGGPDQVIDFHTMQAELALLPNAVPIASYLPSLDAAIGGFRAGELIVLSGPTKHGKTALARTWTRNFMQQGKASLWFSYELPTAEFLESFPELPEGYLPHELRGHALTWLYYRCLESKVKHGCQMIFIDHLHFLVDMAHVKHPSLELGAIVRYLKRMALALDMTVFLLCHLTKLNYEQEPTEQDIRDSSFISQEADATLLIWRKSDPVNKGCFLNESTLVLRNHRRSGVMAKKIPLVFLQYGDRQGKGWLEEKL